MGEPTRITLRQFGDDWLSPDRASWWGAGHPDSEIGPAVEFVRADSVPSREAVERELMAALEAGETGRAAEYDWGASLARLYGDDGEPATGEGEALKLLRSLVEEVHHYYLPCSENDTSNYCIAHDFHRGDGETLCDVGRAKALLAAADAREAGR